VPGLYEAKIKNVGNAGRNGGEYYTPRPLIRAIVQVVKPQIGERSGDGWRHRRASRGPGVRAALMPRYRKPKHRLHYLLLPRACNRLST
jgi:type I restriction enzyme M protein